MSFQTIAVPDFELIGGIVIISDKSPVYAVAGNAVYIKSDRVAVMSEVGLTERTVPPYASACACEIVAYKFVAAIF